MYNTAQKPEASNLESIGFEVNAQEEAREEPESPPPKTERSWNYNGEMLTESDIKMLIWLTEKDQQFRPLIMLKFFIYHFINLTCPFLTPPFVYLCEGFNWNMVVNMQLTTFSIQAIIGHLISLFSFVSIFFYWRVLTSEDELAYQINFSYLTHYFCMVSSRCFVVSVKYALYSDEHFKLLRSFILTNDLLSFDQIGFLIGFGSVDSLERRLQFVASINQIEKYAFNFDLCPESSARTPEIVDMLKGPRKVIRHFRSKGLGSKLPASEAEKKLNNRDPQISKLERAFKTRFMKSDHVARDKLSIFSPSSKSIKVNGEPLALTLLSTSFD